MALPSPSEADAATQRVRLVAEMLLQKASEVESKGNAGAAKSLSDSAADLQRAAALLHELTRHMHAAEPHGAPASNGPPRSQDGRTASNGAQPPASTSVKDLVAKLGRVDAMLGKKSDEMKAKGNEAAANALLQSALAVRVGVQHIADQQQMTRTLVVTARALREQLREQWRLLLEGDVEISDDTVLDDELRHKAVVRVKELLEMREIVRRLHPEASTANALLAVLEAPSAVMERADSSEEIKQLQDQCERLQQQMNEAQARHEVELQAASEEAASMSNQCAVLEKALRDLEAEYHERREREIEHLNALHERQKDTHEELKRLLLAKEEEVSSLKVQAESWMNQLTKERDAQTELQAQREQDRQFYERQVGELREQLQAKSEEALSLKEELRLKLLQVAELEQLQQQNKTTESVEERSASAVLELEKEVNKLRAQLEGVQCERDDLVVSKNEAARAVEEAQAQLIGITKELEKVREKTKLTEEEATTQMQRVIELEAALAEASNHVSNAGHDEEKVVADVAEMDTLRDTIEELRNQLDGQQKSREELETLLVRTQDLLSARQSEVAGHVHRIEELRDVSAREVDEAKKALALQHSEQVAKLQDALESERERVAALEAAVNGQGASADGQSKRIREMEDSLVSKETELAASNERVHQWQMTVDRLADQLEAISSLKELHPVGGASEASDSGLGRVLRALQVHVERLEEQENARAAALKAELGDVLRELSEGGEESTADGSTTVSLTVKLIQERVSNVISELKALHLKQSEALARLEDELEETRREKRDLVTHHEATLEDLRAQHAEETASLSEKLRAAEAEREVTSVSSEDETNVLRAKLAEVESDFERYRTRSHAALKKIEKRAELLNSMRKENESLVQAMAELKERRDAAVEQEARVRKELEEVTKTLRQREEDEASKTEELEADAQELKDRVELLTKEKEELETALRAAEAKTVELQEEKETLANAKAELHEQTLLLKEKEIDEANALVESTKHELQGATERVAVLETEATEAAQKIQELETELSGARDSAVNAADGQAAQLQVQVETLKARVAELESLAEAKTAELATLISSKDEERVRAVNELKEKHATELQGAVALANVAQHDEAHEEQRLQLAAHAEQLKARVNELELASAAAEQEAERLRVEVESMKAALAEAAASGEAAVPTMSAVDFSQLQALQESLNAKEAQIMRLLAELEGLSKHQVEDQRLIAHLKEQLRQSELQLREAEQAPAASALESVDLEALNETIQALRKRVGELEAERSDGEVSTDVNTKPADDQLDKLHASRLEKRAQQEQELEKSQRKQRVADFGDKARRVVEELQLGLEEYSLVFRDACALRDEDLSVDLKGEGEGELNGDANHAQETEYEEYLTFNSGVVIKAGSTFSLPVYCEKPGWRVQWKFAVKEDGADVGFALTVVTKPNDERQAVVLPARMNELSGVCDAPATTAGGPVTAVLQFEWDNTFSWLNEKTLDYHVSVLEPLSVEKKALRVRERQLAASVKTLETRLELLSQEKERREQLQERLLLVEACEKEKDDQVSGFEKRKQAIKDAKTQLQVHMEDLKHKLSALVSELDEMDTHGRTVASAWATLQGELDDVDMTMRLSANSRLDELAATLTAQLHQASEELCAVKRKLSGSSA